MHDLRKMAGIAGIVWGVSNAVLGFSTGQPPELDASGGEIRQFLTDGRGTYLAALAVFGLTLPLLFLFAAELGRRLRRDGHEAVADVLQPAVATLVTGMAFGYVLMVPFIFGDGLGSAATVGMLRYAYVLTFVMTMIGGIGGATLMASVSVGQKGAGAIISRLLAGVVMVAAVGGLVSPAVAMLGGLGLLVVLVWAAVVGIALLREPAAETDPSFATA